MNSIHNLITNIKLIIRKIIFIKNNYLYIFINIYLYLLI